MAIYQVSFDLPSSSRNRDALDRQLASTASRPSVRALGSTWLVKTAETPTALRDRIKSAAPGAKVLVTKVDGSAPRWSTFGIKKVAAWLKRHL